MYPEPRAVVFPGALRKPAADAAPVGNFKRGIDYSDWDAVKFRAQVLQGAAEHDALRLSQSRPSS
jgi:hypothetical protein